jgi:hypothetical protein
MRNRHYTTATGECWVAQGNLDDVLDLDRDRWGTYADKIVCWKKLFGLRDEKAGKQQAKNLFRRMCEMIAQDLIDGHDAFILPKKNFGFLKVGDLSGHLRQDWAQPHPVQGTPVHGGLVYLDGLVTRTNGGRDFMLKLTGPWIKRIREKEAHGHRW